MKWTQELTEYKEQIHLMTKKIIEEQFPEDLFLFELTWSNLWASICQLKDQDPREWNIEDLRLASSSVFSYPSEVANKELKAILLTVASVVADLIAAKKNLTRVEIEEIVNAYIVQHLPPESTHQDIISAFIKTGGNAESTSNPEMGEPPSPLPQEEEKKEYKVYSHESQDEEEIKALFDQINSSQDEDLDFKYRMYTEQDVRENINDALKCGKKLTEEWRSHLEGFYPILANSYKYILDFANLFFFYSGNQLDKNPDTKTEYNYFKALRIILLLPSGKKITFKGLYKRVSDKHFVESVSNNTTQRWFTDLKKVLGVNKEVLNLLFKSWPSKGYEIVKEGDTTFLIVLKEKTVQNISNKFSM